MHPVYRTFEQHHGKPFWIVISLQQVLICLVFHTVCILSQNSLDPVDCPSKYTAQNVILLLSTMLKVKLSVQRVLTVLEYKHKALHFYAIR